MFNGLCAFTRHARKSSAGLDPDPFGSRSSLGAFGPIGSMARVAAGRVGAAPKIFPVFFLGARTQLLTRYPCQIVGPRMLDRAKKNLPNRLDSGGRCMDRARKKCASAALSRRKMKKENTKYLKCIGV